MNSSNEMFNYDEYTRYLNNLNCMYMRIDRRAEVTSIIRDLGKGHRGHSLSVYIGGVGQTLNEREQRVISDLSSFCSTENAGAWIVMDLTLDVVYLSKVIPKDWIARILPHIIRQDEYINDKFLYWEIDPCDPVCLPCAVAQERMISSRYIEILDDLLQLYERGSIVGISRQFAIDWELEVDERGIYHPTWWNTLLTGGDPTLYLQEAIEGRSSYLQEATSAYLRLEAMEDLE